MAVCGWCSELIYNSEKIASLALAGYILGALLTMCSSVQYWNAFASDHETFIFYYCLLLFVCFVMLMVKHLALLHIRPVRYSRVISINFCSPSVKSVLLLCANIVPYVIWQVFKQSETTI